MTVKTMSIMRDKQILRISACLAYENIQILQSGITTHLLINIRVFISLEKKSHLNQEYLFS